MHCNVLGPEILQFGMKTWPFQNPSTRHIRGPAECVRKGNVGRAEGRVGGDERRGKQGKRKREEDTAIYNEVITKSLEHFCVHIIHTHYTVQC